VAFKTDGECGTWFNTARHGSQTSIIGGTWLVGQQVSPGTYVANVAAGCYWERVRDFTGRSNIIANDFNDTGGQRFVTIAATDVGFYTDDQCGTWTKTNAIVSPPFQSQGEIQSNRTLYEWRHAGRRATAASADGHRGLLPSSRLVAV